MRYWYVIYYSGAEHVPECNGNCMPKPNALELGKTGGAALSQGGVGGGVNNTEAKFSSDT